MCENRDQIILTGDFNSKHPELGNDQTKPSGTRLVTATQNNNLTLINDGTPTFLTRLGKEDVNDLIFISQSIIPNFRDFWVGDDHGSDHFIINGVFSYTPIYNKMNEKTVRLFHKADWIDINFSIRTTMTKTTLNKRNVTEDEIDNYVDTLTNTITSVIAEKVPTKSIKRNSMGLPIEIRELIRQKRHQRRLWQKTRVPQYKTNANRLQKRISKDITIRKRDSWKKYCDDMELSEGQDAAWCKIRSVLNPKSASYNYPTLVSRGKGGIKTRSVTTSEKLDTFASQLEAVFTNEIENSVFDEEVKTDVDAELDQPFARARLTYQQVIPFDPDIHPDRIRFGEVTDILGKVNTRKACGPDHITNKIIRYLLPTLHIIIQDLINICVFHGYHPRAWKRAWALMIHKPSKRRSDPCSYRPISLLCCLSKVFEAIMTKRLMSWAENTDQLPTEQSGFRKHHSTNDKLFELTQAVCQAQRLSKRVGAVFLDIEKAFDRVWHNGLRYELLHMNAPALLLRWISSFLRDRTVKVRILGYTSREIAINYGVPQGSPISPLLFLLYLSKLPKLVPNTRRSLFADDSMIYAESSIADSHLIQSNLQTSLDKLTVFNADHRIILSCTKSVRVLFERRKSKKLKPQDVTYNGQVIPASTSVKFLGITFDSALTFKSHYHTIANIARHRLLKLNSIFTSTYGPSTSTLIRLYKSYIRSLFDYGAPATCVASPHVQRIWEGVQTHFITRALSIPCFIHNDRKRQHAYLPPIHDRNLYLAKRWYRRAMLHNSGVQDYVDNHTHNDRTRAGSRNTPLELIRN